MGCTAWGCGIAITETRSHNHRVMVSQSLGPGVLRSDALRSFQIFLALVPRWGWSPGAVGPPVRLVTRWGWSPGGGGPAVVPAGGTAASAASTRDISPQNYIDPRGALLLPRDARCLRPSRTCSCQQHSPSHSPIPLPFPPPANLPISL